MRKFIIIGILIIAVVIFSKFAPHINFSGNNFGSGLLQSTIKK